MRNQLAQTSWKNKFILYFQDGTSPLYSEYGLHGSFSLLFFAFYSSDITRTLIGYASVLYESIKHGPKADTPFANSLF